MQLSGQQGLACSDKDRHCTGSLGFLPAQKFVSWLTRHHSIPICRGRLANCVDCHERKGSQKRDDSARREARRQRPIIHRVSCNPNNEECICIRTAFHFPVEFCEGRRACEPVTPDFLGLDPPIA